jgi:molybdenum cofactor synthesis domain-containing protein
LEYSLLEKSELWISPVKLAGVDLGACAIAVGNVLDLEPGDILVTDVLGDRLTLDILVPSVKAEKIVARDKAILAALAQVSGVTVTPETSVHSEGILGLISLDEATGKEVLERSLAMRDEILERISKRCLVLATGPEVMHGQIRDTNTPYLVSNLREIGYQADTGPVMRDEAREIARAFRNAAEDAYGLVVTTGGVGAEGKDRTLEALAAVDTTAVMPYVLKFHKGQGRHEKDGVRLGAGRLIQTLIVCLSGPHDEVEFLWPVLATGLKAKWDKATLAESLARRLREKFLSRRAGETLYCKP